MVRCGARENQKAPPCISNYGDSGNMEYTHSCDIVTILRDTLRKLEKSSEALQDDPAMIEVKRQIIRTIADLEIAKETAIVLH